MRGADPAGDACAPGLPLFQLLIMIKIGTDIIEISRIEKAIKSQKFLQKCFSPAEAELIKIKGAKTAAANFAGKEAVAKALGCGFKYFFPKDIEILRQADIPVVILQNRAKEIADTLGVISIEISLSHSKNYAVAMVIVLFHRPELSDSP